MMKRIFSLITLLIIFGCFVPQIEAAAKENAQAEISRFNTLNLTIGMKREVVEKKVATLLGRKNEYSPSKSALKGGLVQYCDGDWVLEILYEAGAPERETESADGLHWHFPLKDESVIEYKIKRK